jgi:chromosome segregation ATPase
MDKEQLEAIRGVVREAIKEEIEGLTEIVTDGFEYLNNKVNQVDKRLSVIETQMHTVQVDMGVLKLDTTTVKREIASLGLELGEIKAESQETKTAVLRIEHTLQDKQEAQGDELANQNQRLERIEDHLHLPHSLSAAA